MSTLAQTLPTHLQSLIDIRLDTIDRILLGRIPRPDRITIVEEVSNQIEEMLARKEKDQPEKEDILEVLGRLDPPEAYLPETQGGFEQTPANFTYTPEKTRKTGRVSIQGNKIWLVGLLAGLGTCLFGFIVPPIGFLLTVATESISIFLTLFTLPGIISLLLSIAAITLGTMNPAKKVGDYVLMTFSGLTLPSNLAIIGYSLYALLNI